MKFKCFLGFHNYKALDVVHYLDNSWTKQGTPSTKSIWVCTVCKKTKYLLHYGCGYIPLDIFEKVLY